jgi:hypothetical protein
MMPFIIKAGHTSGSAFNSGICGQDIVLLGGGVDLYGNNGSVGETPVGGNVVLQPGLGVSHCGYNGYYGNIVACGNLYPSTDNAYACGNSANRWGSIYAANGVITTSDETLKDMVPLEYGLDDLMKVSTCKYKWKTQQDLLHTDPKYHHEYYGLKAQELDSIFPELIYKDQIYNLIIQR